MTSIQEQMDAAADGATIVLTEDITESATVPVGKKLTLDLGGFTWKGEAGKPTLTVIGATATVRNGTIYQEGQKTFQVGEKDATVNSYLYLEPGLIVKNYDYCAVFVAKNAYVYTSADISAEGEGVACIQGNGTAPYFDNLVSIDGGTIAATGADAPVAIYWPQRGDLVVKGGKITGDSAIELRAGTLTIIGGELVGTGSYRADGNGNGSTTTGAAVAIAQHTTQLPITVRISGGTFTAEVPFSEANPQNNPAAATDKIDLAISGGTFESTVSTNGAVVSADCKGFVSGGVFSKLDNKYIDASSDIATEGGKTVIRPKSMSGSPMYISDVIAEGAVSSTSQGRLIGTVNELPKGADAIEGTLVYLNPDKRYHRFNGTDWVEEVPGFSATIIDGSERPVTSAAVKAKMDEIDMALDNRYTKPETDALLNKKQDVITGAASSIVTQQLVTGRVLVSDDIGKVAVSTITAAQIDKLSNIDISKGQVQDQIDKAQATADRKVEQTVYDAKVKEISDAFDATSTKISALDTKVGTKQDRLTAGANITIDGSNTISAVIPEAAKPDEALSTESENAVMNKTIAARFKTTDDKFGSYLTKTDAATTYLGIGATAASAKTDAKGNIIDETYALKGDLTSLYKLMGTCTSAELDEKDKVVGHVWNLSDSREYDGKTFKAGTSWLCEYDGTGVQVWEPQTPLFDVDTTGLQKKSVLLHGVTVSSWEDLGETETYRYKGKLGDTRISAADTATVTFGVADAISGDYAPVCDTDKECLYIYSKKQDSVTLALVEIRKG